MQKFFSNQNKLFLILFIVILEVFLFKPIQVLADLPTGNAVKDPNAILRNALPIKQVELKEILQEAQKVSQDGVDAIPGLTIDESFEDKLSVIIIATGLRRYDINDIQNPRIISTNNLIENVENPYVDIELINKINIQDALRRFPN